MLFIVVIRGNSPKGYLFASSRGNVLPCCIQGSARKMTSRGVGIPVKLLHEAEGHTVTVETITGETYRGFLSESEDNMNCKINNLTMTHRDGKTTTLEQVSLSLSCQQFLLLLVAVSCTARLSTSATTLQFCCACRCSFEEARSGLWFCPTC